MEENNLTLYYSLHKHHQGGQFGKGLTVSSGNVYWINKKVGVFFAFVFYYTIQ